MSSSGTNSISLRVKDALKRDAGRGIARLDTRNMEKLGLSSGDLISIKGKRRTVAKAMPGYEEDREASVIRIDGLKVRRQIMLRWLPLNSSNWKGWKNTL